MRYIWENENKETRMIIASPNKSKTLKKVLHYSVHLIDSIINTGMKELFGEVDPDAKQVLEIFSKHANQYKGDPQKLLDVLENTFMNRLNQVRNTSVRNYLVKFYRNYKIAIKELMYAKDLREVINNRFAELMKIAEANQDKIGKDIFWGIRTYARIQFGKKDLIHDMIFAVAVIIVSYFVLMKITHEKNPIKVIRKAKELTKSPNVSTLKKAVILLTYAAIILALILLVRAAYFYKKLSDAEKSLYD